MSSREPMWYCHECHSEMRPLMVPDPHCASCNGTFVEKMENPEDDPREFQHVHDGFDDEGLPPDMDGFLTGLRSLLRPHSPPPNASARFSGPQSTNEQPGNGGAFTIRVERSGNPRQGMRTVIMGNQPRRSDTDHIPLMSNFVGGSNVPGHDRGEITGALMAQYLLAMLGARPGHDDPFLGGAFGGPESLGDGRWGDYVFNQEALDQIITQMMENSNASAPVPATEEIIEKLPREVLVEGCALLEESCAVCKDQFKLETEDPDEQIVVTLPCKHPFHSTCILPWLKSSGTCPVCRFQLIPQPDHHAPGPGPRGGSGSGPSSAGRPRSPPPRSPPQPNTSQHRGSLLDIFNFGSSGSASGNQRRDSRSGHANRRSTDSGSGNFPGSWDEQMD